MAVIILIKRNVTVNSTQELTILLNKLRSVTLMQPGYISGRTLTRLDQLGECLVISSWKSIDHWKDWFNSPERREIQAEIDSLLGEETTYSIYS
jgi:quinol monooxygenase YgiN